MNINQKKNLITRNSVEVLNEQALPTTLKKTKLKVYCGYEPSGPIHLGHLVTITKLLDFQKAGVKPIILLADWHAILNKKGNEQEIEKQTKAWEKGMKTMGLTKAKFITGSSFQTKSDYVEDILTLSLATTVNRSARAMQTVARGSDNTKVSQIIYPLMQIADIKYLDLDFVTSGLEQRKIHALATETLSKINFKKKPIYIHTGIITSLKGPGEKMSSSTPGSMITIQDSKQEIENKIKKAHCPEAIINENPILEITKLLLFPKFNKIIIKRSKEHGGDKTYRDYKDLEKDFSSKKLHPLDLKLTVSTYLEKFIRPIRKSWK